MKQQFQRVYFRGYTLPKRCRTERQLFLRCGDFYTDRRLTIADLEPILAKLNTQLQAGHKKWHDNAKFEVHHGTNEGEMESFLLFDERNYAFELSATTEGYKIEGYLCQE